VEGERCGVKNWRGYRVSSVEGRCLRWWLFVVHGVDEITCKTQSWKLTSSSSTTDSKICRASPML